MANGRGVVPKQAEPHLSVVGNRRQLAQKCEAVTGRETIQIQTRPRLPPALLQWRSLTPAGGPLVESSKTSSERLRLVFLIGGMWRHILEIGQSR